jgi:polar amino acid transport system substrate-binding protein
MSWARRDTARRSNAPPVASGKVTPRPRREHAGRGGIPRPGRRHIALGAALLAGGAVLWAGRDRGRPAAAWAADILPLPASPTLAGIQRRQKLRVSILTGSAPFASIGDDAAEVSALLAADPPPLYPTTDGRRLVGLDADLAAAMAKLLGVGLDLYPVDRFDALFMPLGRGEVDIALGGISRTAQRAAALAFSIPYLTSGHEVFVLGSGGGRFATLRELDQPSVKVGARAGSTGEVFVQRELAHACLRTYASINDLFTALSRGEIDACLAHGTVGRDYSLRKKLSLYSVEKRRVTAEGTAIAARQGDGDFVEFLSQFVRELRQSGDFMRLARRYNQWLRIDR